MDEASELVYNDNIYITVHAWNLSDRSKSSLPPTSCIYLTYNNIVANFILQFWWSFMLLGVGIAKNWLQSWMKLLSPLKMMLMWSLQSW